MNTLALKSVREAMSPPPMALLGHDSAMHSLRRMVQEEASAATVLDRHGARVGVVIEFDLLLAINHVGEEVPVSRVMTVEVEAVSPDCGLEEARRLMLEFHLRRLPVLEDRHVAGVLTRRDVLRAWLKAEQAPHPGTVTNHRKPR